MSILPGRPKSGSARGMPSKCLQTFNDTLRCTILKRVSKIHQLLCIRQTRLTMNWDRELLPKVSPVYNVPIKHRYIQFWQLNSLAIKWGWSRAKEWLNGNSNLLILKEQSNSSLSSWVCEVWSSLDSYTPRARRTLQTSPNSALRLQVVLHIVEQDKRRQALQTRRQFLHLQWINFFQGEVTIGKLSYKDQIQRRSHRL